MDMNLVIVMGILAGNCSVENEPKNIQIGPEMKEIWSIYCFECVLKIHSNSKWTISPSFLVRFGCSWAHSQRYSYPRVYP
jgi:hypothetical protein